MPRGILSDLQIMDLSTSATITVVDLEGAEHELAGRDLTVGDHAHLQSGGSCEILADDAAADDEPLTLSFMTAEEMVSKIDLLMQVSGLGNPPVGQVDGFERGFRAAMGDLRATAARGSSVSTRAQEMRMGLDPMLDLLFKSGYRGAGVELHETLAA